MQERFGEGHVCTVQCHLWTNFIFLWHTSVPTCFPYFVNLFKLMSFMLMSYANSF